MENQTHFWRIAMNSGLPLHTSWPFLPVVGGVFGLQFHACWALPRWRCFDQPSQVYGVVVATWRAHGWASYLWKTQTLLPAR